MAEFRTNWIEVGVGLAIVYVAYKFVTGAENAGNAIGQGLQGLFGGGEKKYTLEEAHNIIVQPFSEKRLEAQVNRAFKEKGLPTGRTPAETFAMQRVADITSPAFQQAQKQTISVLQGAGYIGADGKIDFTRKNTSSSPVSSKAVVLRTPTNTPSKPLGKNDRVIGRDAKGMPIISRG